MKAALNFASRYQKFVDADEHSPDEMTSKHQKLGSVEEEKSSKSKKSADAVEEKSSKYQKFVDASDENLSKYQKFVDADDENLSKYQKFVDADDENLSKYQKFVDTADDYKEDIKVPTKVVAPDAVSAISSISNTSKGKEHESSSSYAEDDNLVNNGQQEKKDFSYQELDDEYGSRPVPASSMTKRRENDRSNREVEKKRVPSQDGTIPEDGEVPRLPSDRIMGHEYGVRPLLDDDELEDDFKPPHFHGSAEIGFSHEHHSDCEDDHDHDSCSNSTVSPQAGLSPAMSPSTVDKSNTDPFSSAPFRRKPKKKRPVSAVSPKPQVDPDPFSKAPFKPKFLSKSKTNQTVGGKGSPLLLKLDNECDSNTASDMFGSIPFATLPRRSKLGSGPIAQVTEYSPVEETCTLSKSSSYVTDLHSSVTQTSPSTKQYIVPTVTNKNPPPSKASFQYQSLESDPFNDVPFNNVKLNKSLTDHTISSPASKGISKSQSFGSAVTSTPAKPKASKAQSSDRGYKQFSNEAEFHSIQSRPSTVRQHSEDHLLQFSDEDEIDEGDEDNLNLSGKVKSRRSPKNYSNAAFSNMSFNDSDEDKTKQGDFVSTMGGEGFGVSPIKPVQSSNLHVSSIRHPAYSKASSSVANASVEAMKVSSGGYDTFTWPRKQRKIPGLPVATNEPFSSKKKEIDAMN